MKPEKLGRIEDDERGEWRWERDGGEKIKRFREIYIYVSDPIVSLTLCTLFLWLLTIRLYLKSNPKV